MLKFVCSSQLFSGGLGDLLNIDSSMLITAGIVIVGAIFLLPQIIYWATGVNLSAFSWARSKEESQAVISPQICDASRKDFMGKIHHIRAQILTCFCYLYQIYLYVGKDFLQYGSQRGQKSPMTIIWQFRMFHRPNMANYTVFANR
jgi:hypothetical protein